ncbi:MAG: putative cadmium-transporting ATPase [Verrucomicrobiae bacterium]|nr:putative cadmium-transporting ATPase [Verrucomicrobiae bacterium]
MANEHEVDISLLPSSGPDGKRCAELLQARLLTEPGVRGVVFDSRGQSLKFRYDPRLVSLVRVQEIAKQMGVEFGQRFERCALRLRGVRCTDCSQGMEKKLEQTSGATRVAINPAAGSIAVEYDSTTADLATFEERFASAGYQTQRHPRTREDLRAAHAEEAVARGRMAILTATCITGLLVGWGGEKLGWLTEAQAIVPYCISYLAGGFYAARRAFRELLTGSVNVDLLMIAAAIGAAIVNEWPEGAALLFLFSLSNTLEQYVLGRTRRAIEALMDLTPDEAVVRRAGTEQRVPVADLRLGEIIIVRPGERIPADGKIVRGQTSVDQSVMTGESVPVERGQGEMVLAATLNQQGAIEVEVTRVAGETTLSRIVELVESAQSEKAQSQRFTDWFGARYTLAVLGLAAVTAIVPVLFLHEPFAQSFYRAMTILVVASPCAVVISIPAAILAAITGAARNGVLFKGGVHLERAADLQAIAFDKTGTLTLGRPRLTDLETAPGVTEDELLTLAASVESLSEHPLAMAVVEEAKTRGLKLREAANMEALVGRGVQAEIAGQWILVGKPQLFTERGAAIPAELELAIERLAAAGKTTVLVGNENAALGVLAIADTLRPSAEAAIAHLRKLGIRRLVMLTGDSRRVACAIANRLGMEAEAELLPEDKLNVIRSLQGQHGSVAMIGDGINDAPALAAANLGISLGGAGTDVALETADVVLMADDLQNLPFAVALARQTKRVIRQNLVFAFAMMLGLVAATFVADIRLPVAVVGHEGSTVLVILNGLRLLRFRRG